MRAKHALLAFVVYLVTQLFCGVLIGVLGGIAYGILHPGFQANSAEFNEYVQTLIMPAAVLTCVPASGLAVALLAFGAFRARREELGLVRASWPWTLGGGLMGVLCGFAFVVVASVYMRVAGHTPEPTGPLSQMAQSESGLLVWMALALLMAPPVEEFVFRGVMLAGLCRSWGRVAGATAVTAIFGLMHMSEAGAFPPAMLVILTVGALCAWFRLRTGSLLPSLLLHMGYNGTLAALMLLGRLLA